MPTESGAGGGPRWEPCIRHGKMLDLGGEGVPSLETWSAYPWAGVKMFSWADEGLEAPPLMLCMLPSLIHSFFHSFKIGVYYLQE